MSSRRSSTSQDEAGPSKRQKVYRACLACVNSKTRCEDVVPRDGCLRCRSKNKICSLVQAEVERSTSRSRAPDEEDCGRLTAMEEGWIVLRRRLDRLEQQTYSHRALPAMASSSSNIITPATTPRPVDIHQLFTTLNWHSIPMTERVFTVASDLGYPDPVARGLVSADQMEMAFHLFKYRFSSLLPLAPFLLSTTSTPTHPFTRLAVLAHAAPTSELWILVEESILAVISGAVGPDVPLALLVLSLAPSPSDATRAPMTALRTIALAYSVGQSMGWDAISHVWHQSRWLTLPEWSSRLDQVLLWENVKNRYNILSLMQGMSYTLATSLADRLPKPASDRYSQCIASIQSDARLVAVFAPILTRLCLAEVESQTSAWDITPLIDAWTSLMPDFGKWQSEQHVPSKLRKYEAHALQFSLAFRMSCSVQRIPSPVTLEPRIVGQTFTGVNLLRYSASLLEIFNGLAENELLTLPAYLHFQTVVSLSVQQRSISYMQKHGGDWHHTMVPIVDKAAQRVRSQVRGLPARMLEMADQQITDEALLPEIDFEAMFGVLPEDWLQAFGLDNAGLSGTVGPL